MQAKTISRAEVCARAESFHLGGSGEFRRSGDLLSSGDFQLSSYSMWTSRRKGGDLEWSEE